MWIISYYITLLTLHLSQISFITFGHAFAYPAISFWNTLSAKFCPSKSHSFQECQLKCVFFYEPFKITGFKCTLFLNFDRILSDFHLEHLINSCLEWRILADRQFIGQILDECMLFVKHCFLEWKCEDTKGT